MPNWVAVAAAVAVVSAGLVVSGALPSPDCRIVSEQPTGPEPEVTVWERVWDCNGETVVQQFLHSGWECGGVWEEGQWVESSCETAEALQARVDTLRAERSGVRNWEEAGQ